MSRRTCLVASGYAGKRKLLERSSSKHSTSGPLFLQEQMSKAFFAFLATVFAMVDEPSSDSIVTWSEQGDSFVIKRLDLLEEQVIPRFFNHRDLLSFVVQLNNHGE